MSFLIDAGLEDSLTAWAQVPHLTTSKIALSITRFNRRHTPKIGAPDAVLVGYRSTVGHDSGRVEIGVRFSLAPPIYWSLV